MFVGCVRGVKADSPFGVDREREEHEEADEGADHGDDEHKVLGDDEFALGKVHVRAGWSAVVHLHEAVPE